MYPLGSRRIGFIQASTISSKSIKDSDLTREWSKPEMRRRESSRRDEEANAATHPMLL